MKTKRIDTGKNRFTAKAEESQPINLENLNILRNYRRELLQYVALRRRSWNNGNGEERARLCQTSIEDLTKEADRVQRVIENAEAVRRVIPIPTVSTLQVVRA